MLLISFNRNRMMKPLAIALSQVWRRLQGEDSGGNLTNVQCKPYSELSQWIPPPHDKYILMNTKKKTYICTTGETNLWSEKSWVLLLFVWPWESYFMCPSFAKWDDKCLLPLVCVCVFEIESTLVSNLSSSLLCLLSAGIPALYLAFLFYRTVWVGYQTIW
jgi:hypothetical protein